MFFLAVDTVSVESKVPQYQQRLSVENNISQNIHGIFFLFLFVSCSLKLSPSHFVTLHMHMMCVYSTNIKSFIKVETRTSWRKKKHVYQVIVIYTVFLMEYD